MIFGEQDRATLGILERLLVVTDMGSFVDQTAGGVMEQHLAIS